MSTYSVRVTREGKWWMISVPEVDGLTQARRLTEVEEMARSLITSLADVRPSGVELDITITAIEDANLSELKDGLAEERGELERTQDQFSQRLRREARHLSENGIPARDIGYLLGVSHQRAAQLLNTR